MIRSLTGRGVSALWRVEDGSPQVAVQDGRTGFVMDPEGARQLGRLLLEMADAAERQVATERRLTTGC